MIIQKLDRTFIVEMEQPLTCNLWCHGRTANFGVTAGVQSDLATTWHQPESFAYHLFLKSWMCGRTAAAWITELRQTVAQIRNLKSGIELDM